MQASIAPPRTAIRGSIRRAYQNCLFGLGAVAAFASSTAHAQYADWTANPPKILPNERPGSGASWYAGSGRQFPNWTAFAALNVDGSIKAWGELSSGGTGAPKDGGYTAIYSNMYSFAALKADGSIKAWGNSSFGGSGAPTDSGYTSIYGAGYAFAALKAVDGSIKAWGYPDYGGSGAPTDGGYTAIYSNLNAFASLKADGSIKAWGYALAGGSDAPKGTGYTTVYSSAGAFAALKTEDGTIKAWGNPSIGGTGAPTDGGYTAIYSNMYSFAALKGVDGSIKAWGDPDYGGSGAPTDSGYIAIYSNEHAFAALKADGSITVWGESASGGSGSPTDAGYAAIYSSRYAFAALKREGGSIKAWGNSIYGATGAPTDGGYTAVQASHGSFAALKADGSITAWGNTNSGGTGAPTDTGYAAIYPNGSAFAALKADGSIMTWGTSFYGGIGAPSGGGFNRIQAVFSSAALVLDPQITATLGSITSFSAVIGGNITTMSNKTAASRGVVYALASSIADPRIGGTAVTQVVETPLGSSSTFEFNLSGLTSNMAYTYKAYVTDTDGVTYYSPVATFSTNLPPSITSNGGSSTAAVSVAENSSAVTTVQGTDADPGQTLSYSITGGTDAARFAINATTGALTFVTAPNYEVPTDTNYDRVYQVIVTATDNGNPPKSATQTINVTVSNAADSGEIAVEQPAASNVATGGTVAFGSTTIGQPLDLVFTVRSSGEVPLLLNGAAFSGTNAGDFALVGGLPPSIDIGSSATFTVRFAPSASDARSAVLRLSNNDQTGGESSFVINLSGTGATASTLASYANAANQVRGGWINGTDFTIGAVTTNWNSSESPDKAVDNSTGSKFLLFRNNNAGLILSPTNASVVFNRLSLYTANDSSERDPASYVIYGSSTVLTGTSGTNLPLGGLTQLASGTIVLPDNRTTGPTVVQFANTTAYASYIVAFPTVRSTSGNSLTQISEVQLSQGINPPFTVAMAGARGGQLSGTTFTIGSIGNSNPGTNWNANESPDQAVDGSVDTKYLLFRNTGAGLVASPQAGPARVNRLTFWTANDSSERDPLTYQVYGIPTAVTARSGTLNMATSGTLLGSGTLALSATRNAGPETVTFDNSTSYASYLVVFPTVKNSPSTTMMQISEVQFGYNGTPAFALSAATITVAEDSGSYSSAAFATDITPGVGDVGQTVSLSYTNDNNALFSAQPSISDDGTLTFTPAANAYGTAVVSVIATDSTGLSNTKTFSIQITSVIDVPVLAAPTVSNISAYSASFLGAVTQNPDSVTIAGNGFIYAPTAAGSTLEYFGAGAVTVRVDDPAFTASAALVLSSSMSYRIRSYCYGPAGMVYSEVTNFTTLQGNAVMLDNTSGLSQSLARTAVSGGPPAGFFLTSPVGSSAQSGWAYRITTGNQAIILNTLTLALNSSGSCTLRIQLYESGGASPVPQGALLFTHTEATRNFGNDGQYATIQLSDWSLASNQSYVMKVEAISGSAIWRYYDFYPALNSSAGWSSDKVYMTSGDTMTLANFSLPALQMTGTLVETNTHQELWRFENFGSYDSASTGADDADPDHDGLNNLLEYALGLDPNVFGVMPATLALNGANLEYTYTRSTAAKDAGAAYQIQWSDTLEVGSWSTQDVTEQITSTQGALETVKASVPAGSGGKRFLRLQVVK